MSKFLTQLFGWALCLIPLWIAMLQTAGEQYVLKLASYTGIVTLSLLTVLGMAIVTNWGR